MMYYARLLNWWTTGSLPPRCHACGRYCVKGWIKDLRTYRRFYCHPCHDERRAA